MKEIKRCLTCDKTLTGRADKKFCGDQCRNEFNNGLKFESNNLIRNINNALRRNRRILEELFSADPLKEKVTVPKSKLADHGLRFNYFTHIYTNKNGAIYYYCYDYGYLALDNDWFLLVKQTKT